MIRRQGIIRSLARSPFITAAQLNKNSRPSITPLSIDLRQMYLLDPEKLKMYLEEIAPGCNCCYGDFFAYSKLATLSKILSYGFAIKRIAEDNNHGNRTKFYQCLGKRYMSLTRQSVLPGFSGRPPRAVNRKIATLGN